MAESTSSVLGAWSTFYIMTGSSAAALVGLMFVVITLATGSGRTNSREARLGTSTFSTPTVVHFGSALLVSAILAAPWPSLGGPATLLGLAGACGAVYVSRVFVRTKRLTTYSADVDDWIWYTILPFVAYGAVLVGAIGLLKIPEGALFSLAAGVALLIFIGIRNAWDIVTYVTIGGPDEPPKSEG